MIVEEIKNGVTKCGWDGGKRGIDALAILFAFVLFGLTFSSCKACCNKESKDPAGRNAAKPVEEAARPDDKKTEIDVVAEARKLALEAKAETEKVKGAIRNYDKRSKTKNWDAEMNEINRIIREMTQAADRAEALEKQALGLLGLESNPQRNLVVIERVARTTMWATAARDGAMYMEVNKAAMIKNMGKEAFHIAEGKLKQSVEARKKVTEKLEQSEEAWMHADKARADAELGHENGDSDSFAIWFWK